MQPAASVSSTSAAVSIPARTYGGYGNAAAAAKNPNADADADKLRNKYAKATAIGSDSFFDRGEDRQAVQEKLNKYSGSKAISSDAYFDRKPADEDDESGTSPDTLGTIDIGDALNAVADQAEQLKKAAAKFFSGF